MNRYSRAVVIDGLGGPGGHATEDGSELTTSEVDDIRASGMTCLHLTVGEVGTMPPDEAYQRAVESIARWEAEVDRYPATMNDQLAIETAVKSVGNRSAVIHQCVKLAGSGVQLLDGTGRLVAPPHSGYQHF